MDVTLVAHVQVLVHFPVTLFCIPEEHISHLLEKTVVRLLKPFNDAGHLTLNLRVVLGVFCAFDEIFVLSPHPSLTDCQSVDLLIDQIV